MTSPGNVHESAHPDDSTQAAAKVAALREIFADAKAHLDETQPTLYHIAGQLSIAIAELSLHEPQQTRDALQLEAVAVAVWAVHRAKATIPDSWDYVETLHRLADTFEICGDHQAQLFTQQQIVQLIARYPERFGLAARLHESRGHVHALEDVHGPAFALAEIEHVIAEVDATPPPRVMVALFADIVRLRLKFQLFEDAIVAAEAAITLFATGYDSAREEDSDDPAQWELSGCGEPTDVTCAQARRVIKRWQQAIAPASGTGAFHSAIVVHDAATAWEWYVANSVGMIIAARPRQAGRVLDLLDSMLHTAAHCFGAGSHQVLAARLQRSLWEITIATAIRREHVAELSTLRDDIVLQEISHAHTADEPPNQQTSAAATEARIDDRAQEQQRLALLSARVNAHLGLTMLASARHATAAEQTATVLRHALKDRDILDEDLVRRVETGLQSLQSGRGNNTP
ncbi:hypothetical protein ACFPVT_07425 [Corynebacterium choanae]|uniref:Uncharacterized protein n=1 Tax=Corynebacterium choanae TaxID=1862358 RepID=A0A3G6JBB1_9CORY|nr:hypothetical protein [Corynebacterium choanae]AZA13930.1 hypothetical protein CCHOA_07690 [Corynebacterium choanae]